MECSVHFLHELALPAAENLAEVLRPGIFSAPARVPALPAVRVGDTINLFSNLECQGPLGKRGQIPEFARIKHRI
jgi:hypothetical protein